jgi:hypothetical protein
MQGESFSNVTPVFRPVKQTNVEKLRTLVLAGPETSTLPSIYVTHIRDLQNARLRAAH